jgi:hypothetical protein
MFGNDSEEGIVYTILKHLFLRDLQKVELAIIEIYNDSLKDLISGDPIKFHNIDQGQFSYVENKKRLKEVEIHSVDKAVEIVREAASKRKQGSTDINNTSSRSHLMIRIRAIHTDNACEPSEILLSDLGILSI